MEEKIIKKKKKAGRPKKRGPKRKHKYSYVKIKDRNKVKNKSHFDYKIVLCYNNKQFRHVDTFQEIKDAYTLYNNIKEESSHVEFPKTIVAGVKKGKAKYECLLLKQDRDGTVNDMSERNDYGILTPLSTNSEKWRIFDKFEYQVEETFYVWGHHPKNDRKTFRWIYENLIKGDIETQFDFVRISVYLNKFLIKHDTGEYDIIFCKSKEDAIKFYNMVKNNLDKDKIKQVRLLGAYGGNNEKTRNLLYELTEQTGLPRERIKMGATRYY